MSSRALADVFDAHYYATDCGQPYLRNEIWLGFFGGIADKIVSDIQPASVLDVGCAIGLLVECLRDRGVEAFGLDISEYAIHNVYEPIRPYCRLGSATEDFHQRYDLITCVEVLEHMPADLSERAVANICRYTDDVLFSSTPFDYAEATHFNVQPPEYWADLFARQGFYRDVDFDASFLTAWAVRFRRRKEPVQRIVRDYERAFWVLKKENVDLRRSSMAGLQAEIDRLQGVAHDLARQVDAYAAWQAGLQSSPGWRVLSALQRCRGRLFPPGSLRDRILRRSRLLG